MSTQSGTEAGSSLPVAARASVGAFAEDPKPAAKPPKDDDSARSRRDPDPVVETYEPPSSSDSDDLNAVAFGGSPSDQPLEVDDVLQVAPSPSNVSHAEVADPAAEQEEVDEEEIDPLAGMTDQQIATYHRDLRIKEQALAYVQQAASDQTFLASKGWRTMVRKLDPTFSGIAPKDLAEQRAAFIEAQTPIVAQELLLDWLVLELIKLAATCQRHIAVLNSKGGSGKTPLAVYLASVLQWAIKMAVIIYDANENDGTTADHMGVAQSKTKTIRYMMDNLDQFTDYAAVSRLLGTPVRTGTFVVASDKGAKADFTMEDLASAFTQVNTVAAHSSVSDCGNGSASAANEAAVKTATDLAFAARADDLHSIKALLSTMRSYVLLGYGDKVRRAFIVVNMTEPGDTKEKFIEQLRVAADATEIVENGEERKLTLAEFNISEQRLLMVPFDRHIKDRQIADPTGINTPTLISILEVLTAIFGRPEVEDDTKDTASAIPAGATALPRSTDIRSDDDSPRGLG